MSAPTLATQKTTKAVLAHKWPYNDPASGDLIIRTVDERKFYVHRVIMANASPVFADMFSLPPCPSDGEKPEVNVSESRETWSLLLQFCYLCMDEPVLPLRNIRALLAAAEKYHMAAVTRWIRRTLSRPEYLGGRALRTYAIACAHDFPDVARLAARESLRLSVDHDNVEELGLISARQYKDLLDYRKRCSAAAVAALSGIFKMASIPAWVLEHKTLLGGCLGCREKGKGTVQVRDITGREVVMHIRAPWMRYFADLQEGMEAIPLPSLSIQPFMLDPAIRAVAQCQRCGKKILQKTNAFAEQVQSILEEAISAVQLEVTA